jgi:hypothetical protein
MSKALDIFKLRKRVGLLTAPLSLSSSYRPNGEVALLSFAWRPFSSSEIPGK